MKELLTESRLKTFRRCPREHQYRYIQGYRPLSESDALRLGSLIHKALEAYWSAPRLLFQYLDAALEAIALHSDGMDAFEIVRAEEMMRGYDARWGEDDAECYNVTVEEEFRIPLVNPETGAPSRTFDLAGKLDVKCEKDGKRKIIEHKTASNAESNYWERLSLDGQVSGYLKAANVSECTYDVLVKPGLRPLKATPVEQRKYTQPKIDKQTGVVLDRGRLYANQRDMDETPAEFRLRVREEIAANPDTYYQRADIVRLESEIKRHDLETWHQALVMREQRRFNIAPMNTDACIRFGQKCSYFDVCCGTASLEDQSRFERLDWPHSELQKPKEEADHEHEAA